MKKKTSIVINLLFIGLFTGGALGQTAAQKEKDIFVYNLGLYQQKDYQKAEKNFAILVSKLPDSPLRTTNYLMLIKSQYKLGDYVVAIDHSKTFIETYPNSHYRDDVLYIMGNSYYQLTRYGTAVKCWVDALDIYDDPRLVKKIEPMISATINQKLSPVEINNLYQDIVYSPDGQMLVNIAWAKKEIAAGGGTSALARLSASVKQSPNSRYAEKANQLLSHGGSQSLADERFAFLLPLSGFNQEVGNAILEGAHLALDEYNKQHNLNLKIATYDYGEDIGSAIRGVQTLAQNPNIIAAIGPLENDIATACAAISSYEQLPLVSPTATDNDLTGFSDYFFQLSSTIDITAETLAKYALDSLHLRRFATFSPMDEHFIKMVDTFTSTVESAGAEIVSQAWYYPGDQDVYKQFMKLKRVGLKIEFTDSLTTKFPEITVGELDSLYKEYVTLEEEKLEETKSKIDSADIPIKTIDGIFIPIFKEDIQFIAPQIAYSNIQAQYLGNGDWYDSEQLKKNKNYINGLVFGSDGYLNEESWDFRQFRNQFRTKYKKTPDVYAIIGYDTFKYLLKAYDPKVTDLSRTQFLRNLNNIGGYEGIYKTIKLGNTRFNQNLKLIKYNYGQFIPVK